MDGDTIFELVCKDQMQEEYVEQMKAMCRRLYEANTNIDYFPTNFVVNNRKLYYVDYECNDYMQQWDFENWGIRYWRKTPEFLEYEAAHR